MKIGAKLYAFVLIPFEGEFEDVYKLGIKPACDELDIYCERVDETNFLGAIYDKIVNSITKADIIIADLTNRNANVYYETGYAHAMSKVVIHLCKDIKEIPFDLRGFQHIVYSGKIVDLKENLIAKLKWAREYIESKGTELGELSFEFYQNTKKIENSVAGNIHTTYRGDGSVGQMRTSLAIDIFNSGNSESQMLGPVYVYTGREVIAVSSESDLISELPKPAPSDDPEFHFRHKVDFRQKFSASEWISLPLEIFFKEGFELDEENTLSANMKLRFLTESTPIDFPLSLHSILVSTEPPIDIVINGECFPSVLEATLQKEFHRDGTIEEAGFQIGVGIRNKSSQRLKVGPMQIHTNDLVKKFDTSGLILGLGKEQFERSFIDTFTRKFAESDINDIDAFAFEVGEMSFELDARKLPRNVAELEIPFLMKLFTGAGPIDYNFTVKFVA